MPESDTVLTVFQIHLNMRRGVTRETPALPPRSSAAWQIGVDVSHRLIAWRVEKVKWNDAICHRWVFKPPGT